jgi:predicted DNA-binding transcriptional regulator YafY
VTPGAVTVLDAEPDSAVLTARRAIADGVRVRFSYRGRSDSAPATRTVEPWAVELSEGAWYLHGHDQGAGAGRVFRLDRATEMVATDEPGCRSRGARELGRRRDLSTNRTANAQAGIRTGDEEEAGAVRVADADVIDGRRCCTNRPPRRRCWTPACARRAFAWGRAS